MHISSSSAGLYPAPLSTARKLPTPAAQQLVPVAIPVAKEAVETSLSAQQPGEGDVRKEVSSVAIASILERRNIEGSNNTFNGTARQQAVAAYADVATQEHREELVALLGIDVFA